MSKLLDNDLSAININPDKNLSALKTINIGSRANRLINEGMTANSNSSSYHL